VSKEYSPWLTYPHIWKTKSAWLSWLRGGIRRSLWSKSPIKLEMIKKNRKKIPNPHPKGRVKEVWGLNCDICKKDFPTSYVDVDHKGDSHSLRDVSDLQSFIEGIVFVTEDDLQFACKGCHKIRNHSQKKNISFDDAAIEKLAIDLLAKKMDKEWITAKGITPASNAKLRRQQIIDLLREEKENAE
jgi:hypothetical protein